MVDKVMGLIQPTVSTIIYDLFQCVFWIEETT